MSCFNEIRGILKLALYVNKGVTFRRPNPSIENEIDIITHQVASVVIDEPKEFPNWERQLNYSGNYKQNYQDIFRFNLHGLKNGTPEILELLRNTRVGFICEIITKGLESFVFPTPVFVNEQFTKPINSRSWQVSMSYRVPTFDNYLIKLNTLLMTQSYIQTGENSVLGSGVTPIVSS